MDLVHRGQFITPRLVPSRPGSERSRISRQQRNSFFAKSHFGDNHKREALKKQPFKCGNFFSGIIKQEITNSPGQKARWKETKKMEIGAGEMSWNSLKRIED